jgi:2-phosphosulfolactate phosphatase
MPAPGFDHGNSPSALMHADLAGVPVGISTAAGVQGLHRFRHTRRQCAASLVCAGATAEARLAPRAVEVPLVIAGEWIDRDGDEDIACADYIETLLRGVPAAPEEFGARLRSSDLGKRLAAGAWPHLPPADLEIAAHADLFDFAMPVRFEEGDLVIR